MQVAQIIGGLSLGKADILRSAMGKKKEKEMEKMKKEFLEGAAVRGYDKKLADDIFEMLKPFAGYGVNKSHAAAYSVVAYKTAYLKANYPAEFMAANLTNEINSPDAFSDYLTSTKEMGIEILPPDINLSEKTFTVVDGKIFYALQRSEQPLENGRSPRHTRVIFHGKIHVRKQYQQQNRPECLLRGSRETP